MRSVYGAATKALARQRHGGGVLFLLLHATANIAFTGKLVGALGLSCGELSADAVGWRLRQVMGSIILTVFGAILSAVIYAYVFGGREERIREYLRTRAFGWLRRRYLRAMVGAVRGDAAVLNARILVGVALVFLILVLVGFWYDSWRLQSNVRTLEADSRTTDRELSRLLSSYAEPSRSVVAAAGLRKELDDMVASQKGINVQIEGLRRRAFRLVVIERAAAGAVGILFLVGFVLWLPYVDLRARFAHEIERFSLRIQGLASKEELARLTVAELAVRDPETLRRYVEVMKEVATRHGVPELTRTFELWQE